MSVVELVELVRPAGYVVLAAAALLLVAESALLIGVVLPGISVPVGLGVLAATGAVPLPVAAGTAVAAAVLGPSLGYRTARRAPSGPAAAYPPERSRVLGRVPGLARSHPLVAVGVGQWFAVSRTLAPRIAGTTLPYRRFVLINAPMAALWALTTVGLGHLLARGSRAAARVLAAFDTVGLVLLGVVVLVLLATGITLLRRSLARPRPRSDDDPADEGTPRDDGVSEGALRDVSDAGGT